ncbi:hypothetical protein PVAG01_07840 [Phlyctema vagabunda]|uniref:Uncharacterized protein n=1 Tax=Phlyctema vagabunda TaxID=108571 RepID=A0ABR4PDJ9_9HELO
MMRINTLNNSIKLKSIYEWKLSILCSRKNGRTLN